MPSSSPSTVPAICTVASANTDTLSVLPVASGTLFGVGVTANTLTTLERRSRTHRQIWPSMTGTSTSQNIRLRGFIQILPQTSGTIFGVSVTADSLADLPTGTATNGLAFDSSGNLYLTGSGISVIAKSAGTIFGVAVARTQSLLSLLLPLNTPSPTGLPSMLREICMPQLTWEGKMRTPFMSCPNRPGLSSDKPSQLTR